MHYRPQSAVLRLHVVRLSVRPSVCL